MKEIKDNMWYVLFFLLILSVSINHTVAQTVADLQNNHYNADPSLLTGEKIEYPPQIFKKKKTGVITVEVDISDSGLVEKCTVKQPVFTLLDSIVYNAVMRSRFSPAYDRGIPVPSTIEFQIPFDPDSIISSGTYGIKELEGIVADKDSKCPLPGVVVNLQYKDTASDTLLSGNFNCYMETIGKIPGQRFSDGIMSTTTDSSGRFSFRLLPDGVATVALLVKGYSIMHFTESIRTGENKQIRYLINPYTEEIDSVYQINVYGRDSSGRETVNVEQQQLSSGLTHYLSKIILTKATILQVPEAGSALLVRSGSPYDNRYLVAGVPMLAPFHFGGYPYADIDGVMLSAVDDIDLTVNRIGGTFPEVSGVLIKVNPGIYRPSPKKLKKRTELTLDFSTISQDFLLSFPLRKQDCLQIGVTRSEDFSLRVLKASYQISPDAEVGIAPPFSFGNVTLTGRKLFGKMQTECFSWFAFDIYESYTGIKSAFYPWGMASIKMYPINKKNVSLTVGGAHQYFADGIRVGSNSFLKTVKQKNGICTFNYDSIRTDIVNVDVSGSVNYSRWHGAVTQRDERGLDTAVIGSGDEVQFDCKTTLVKNAGPLEIGSNLLFTGITCGGKPQGAIDAGLSLLWKSTIMDLEFNIGKITSHPDIRGIPDSAFRKKQLITFIVSAPLKLKYNYKATLGIQPYARYLKNAPQLDPLLKAWDPVCSTPLKAAGVDCDVELKPLRWLELKGAVNISRAYRDNDGDSIYEWGIPLTFRGRATFRMYHDLLYFYIEGKFNDGLPYFDFVQKRYERLPHYQRVDISFQYRSPILKHRFLTRYDVYFRTSNLVGKYYNVRTYYWDCGMMRHPIDLSGPVYTEVGARLGFRL